MNIKVNDTITLVFQNNELYLEKTTDFFLPDAPTVIGIKLGSKNRTIFTVEFAINTTGFPTCPANDVNIAFNLVG
jgi:hypothetical protein